MHNATWLVLHGLLVLHGHAEWGGLPVPGQPEQRPISMIDLDDLVRQSGEV